MVLLTPDLEKTYSNSEATTFEPAHTPARIGVAVERTMSIRSIRDNLSPAAARIPVEFTKAISIIVDTREDARGVSTRPGSEISEKKSKEAMKDIAALDWHTISTSTLFQHLSVSPSAGLDAPQAARRLSTYGSNNISPPPRNMLKKVLEWLFGGFGTLLLGASLLCFIAWKPLGSPPLASNLALAVVLLIVLLLQTIFNAWQDFSISRIMSSIQNLLPSNVTVIRNSAQVNIVSEQLVPGDVVVVAMGMKIPADLRMIECTGDCMFDRSILTGESEPVPATVDKTDDNFLETKNIALQGTHCTSGSGKGVVVQTGDLTVFGRIATLSSQTSGHLTTLQREIFRLVLFIASIAALVAILIVILWAAWLRRAFPNFINVPNLLTDVVSVVVGFLPTGLPIALTISMAKVAGTLSKHKVLCKSLSIVETLGAVNVLCSDKTGTLTQNCMHVENVAVYDLELDLTELRDRLMSGGKAAEAPSDQSDLSTKLSESETARENLAQLGAVAGICNAAAFAAEQNEKPLEVREIIGDATDSAILRFAESIAPVEASLTAWQEVHKVNFNSKTKYMLKLSKLSSAYVAADPRPAPIASWDDFSPNDYLLTVKGAPEVLFPRCSYVLAPGGGEPFRLSPDILERIVSLQDSWAAQGRRVLVLARKVIREEEISKHAKMGSQTFAELVNDLTEDLVIVGLVGLVDPLREDIVDTVRVCRGAGIRFFVVTGDHPATAVAISAQAGIVSDVSKIHHFSDLDPKLPVESIPPYVPVAEDDDDPRPMKGIVVTGSDMTKFTGSQLDQLCTYDEIVFARTTPEQKLFIVRAFQTRDCIVAMTGDGVNDSASLRVADCGIAMGSGSDVAREAADMVLLDSFGSIVVALEYGRLVYDNLKKTCLYLLPAGSFSELMPILVNIFLGVPQMLSNLQMILICVATDIAPALSLCMEQPESGLLRRRPRNVKTDHLVDWRLLLHAYGFLGVLESLCAMSMSFWYLQRQGVPFSELVFQFGNWPTLTTEDLYRAQSVYFFTLVIMQWGNLLSTRCRKFSIFQHTPAKNWYLVPAMICALVVAIFFSYIPFFQNAFLTRGIPAEHYFIPVAFGAALLFLDETRKYFVRRNPRGVAWLAW
ncbi:sodium-potassium ATPase [Gautieria morchelliformis]|nr:sodium-potassium ATPase [Gautieria morchelliformis]